MQQWVLCCAVIWQTSIRTAQRNPLPVAEQVTERVAYRVLNAATAGEKNGMWARNPRPTNQEQGTPNTAHTGHIDLNDDSLSGETPGSPDSHPCEAARSLTWGLLTAVAGH